MTIEIPLTKGYVAVIDEEDADLASKNWCADVCNKNLIYAITHLRIAVGRFTSVRLHRIIGSRIVGRDLEQGEIVDHCNGNGLDNRRANIRVVNKSINSLNSRLQKRNKSGYRGVRPHALSPNLWTAEITVNGVCHYLGLFDDPQKAHQAYCEAAKRYRGALTHHPHRQLSR